MRFSCTSFAPLSLLVLLGAWGCALLPVKQGGAQAPAAREELVQGSLDLATPLREVGETLVTWNSSGSEENFSPMNEDLPDTVYPEEETQEEEEGEEEFPLPLSEVPPGSFPSTFPASGILGEKELETLLQQNHPYVDRWIQFFTETEKGRAFFSRSLLRMQLYGPWIARWLKENGLPPKLVWLAFIESGMNPNALSRARAKGIWQFIRSTGRRYNLHRTPYVDERADPYLSTLAASRYLKDLYLNYGSWELALAAYNAGERRIDRASRKAGHNDYWQMLHYPRRILPRETKHYVPKLIAAYRIGIRYEEYGFSLSAEAQPLTWETIQVPGGISLNALAEGTGVPLETLTALNPSLRRGMTPPGDSFPLRVPPDKGEAILAYSQTLPRLTSPPPLPPEEFITYRVKKGDTLHRIARRFGVSVAALKDENDLKSSRIRPGQRLLIPRYSSRTRLASRSLTSAYPEKKGSNRTYRVRPGDTLWGIAKRFGVTLQELAHLNQISPRSTLRAGKLLKIPPLPES